MLGRMTQPDRDRILSEIASLSDRLETLRAELTAIDGLDDGYEGDDVTTVLDTRRSVPAPADADRTVAEAPQGRRVPEVKVPRPSLVPPPARTPDADFQARYVMGEQLGEGGMGEVRVFTDKRIGRAVAMKVLHPQSASMPRLRERFLFEGRVQGQLEHPSIVPVYDLGVRPDGLDYFTMKRVVGKTLSQVLKDLRRGDRAAAATYTRRRLLLAFQSVCLAAEFAHQRGVVHRDLKPSNVMLGAYGEVSVLDWGVAKLVRTDPPVTPTPEGAAALQEAHTKTAVGEILGTPGYMSPEQAYGGVDVGPHSDVFALGSILYEILTLQKLVPGSTDQEVREATMKGRYDPRPSSRFPEMEIPPELEEIVVAATQLDAAARTRSARSLYEQVERWLEGEGEERRRASLARRHTRAAISAVAEAAEGGDPQRAAAARARAIHEVTRALALDPDNPTALRTMIKLTAEVPSTATPEAERAVQEIEAVNLRKTALRGTLAYVAVAVNLALAALLGVERWGALAAPCVLILAAAALAFYASRQAIPSHLMAVLVLALSSTGFAMAGSLFGPFVFGPILCALNTVVVAIGFNRRIRALAVGFGIVAVVTPVAAQLAGWMEPSWLFHDGVIEIVPRVVRFSELPTTLFLTVVFCGMVLIPALLVGAERDARVAAERKLALHAHQLAEFVPAEAKEHVASVRGAGLPGA